MGRAGVAAPWWVGNGVGVNWGSIGCPTHKRETGSQRSWLAPHPRAHPCEHLYLVIQVCRNGMSFAGKIMVWHDYWRWASCLFGGKGAKRIREQEAKDTEEMDSLLFLARAVFLRAAGWEQVQPAKPASISRGGLPWAGKDWASTMCRSSVWAPRQGNRLPPT